MGENKELNEINLQNFKNLALAKGSKKELLLFVDRQTGEIQKKDRAAYLKNKNIKDIFFLNGFSMGEVTSSLLDSNIEFARNKAVEYIENDTYTKELLTSERIDYVKELINKSNNSAELTSALNVYEGYLFNSKKFEEIASIALKSLDNYKGKISKEMEDYYAAFDLFAQSRGHKKLNNWNTGTNVLDRAVSSFGLMEAMLNPSNRQDFWMADSHRNSSLVEQYINQAMYELETSKTDYYNNLNEYPNHTLATVLIDLNNTQGLTEDTYGLTSFGAKNLFVEKIGVYKLKDTDKFVAGFDPEKKNVMLENKTKILDSGLSLEKGTKYQGIITDELGNRFILTTFKKNFDGNTKIGFLGSRLGKSVLGKDLGSNLNRVGNYDIDLVYSGADFDLTKIGPFLGQEIEDIVYLDEKFNPITTKLNKRKIQKVKEGEGANYAVIKVPVAVVEEGAFMSGAAKQSVLDETTIANNARSLEGQVLLGGLYLTKNNDGTWDYNNEASNRIENFVSDYFSPLLTSRNAISLHHTLMYSILLSKIDSLSIEEKQTLLSQFMNNTSRGGTNGFNLINKLYFTYFKKKGLKTEDLNLNNFEKAVLSKDFYDMFFETKSRKFAGDIDLIKSKRSLGKDINYPFDVVETPTRPKGKVAEMGYRETSRSNEIALDNTEGFMSQKDYLNFLIKFSGGSSFISQDFLDSLITRGFYNYENGYKGTQANNFKSISASDATILGKTKGNYANDSSKTAIDSEQPVFSFDSRNYSLDNIPKNNTYNYEQKYKKIIDPEQGSSWGRHVFAEDILNKRYNLETNKDKKINLSYKEDSPSVAYDRFVYEMMNALSKASSPLSRASKYGWSPKEFILNFEPRLPVYSAKDGNYHLETNTDTLGKVVNADKIESELKDIVNRSRFYDIEEEKIKSIEASSREIAKKVTPEMLKEVLESKKSFEMYLNDVEKDIENETFSLFKEQKPKPYEDLYYQATNTKPIEAMERASKLSVREFNSGDQRALHKMFDYDPLSTSGIRVDGDEPLDIQAGELINRIGKDAYMLAAGLSKNYMEVFQNVEKRKLINETNQYSKDKALVAIVDHLNKILEKTTSDKEKTSIKLEISAHINSAGKTLEDATKNVAFFEKNFGDIAYNIYKLNERLLEESRTISVYNDEVAEDVFWMLTPTITKQQKKAKNTFIRQALFSYNKPEKDKIINMYLNGNYFESMKGLIKQVVTSNSYKNFKDRAVSLGLMENNSAHNFVVEEIFKTFDDVAEDINGKNDLADYKLLVNMINSNLIDGQKFGESNGESFGLTAGHKYLGLLNQLRDFTMKTGKSYSEAIRDLRLDTVSADKSKFNRNIIKAYDYQNDIVAALLIKASKKDNDIATKLFTALKGKAQSEGLELVDKFGRIYRDDVKDFRTLGSHSTEYVKSILKYFSTYNGGFEANVLMDAINGDAFFMNGSLARHADKYIFTQKVPGPILGAFKKISSWATQLIMASPLKLIDRFLMFTGFDLTTLGLANPKTPLKLGEAANMISEFLQSGGASLTPELKEYLFGRGVNLKEQTTEAIFNSASESKNIGGPLKPWFDTVSKTLSAQHELGRFAFYLASLEDIKSNKGNAKWLGAAYNQKNAIKDAFTDIADSNGELQISKEAQQALYIMGQQIGAVNDFPILAKQLSGYLMFTTFPLAHLRWARGELKSFATATKELLFESDNRAEALRHLSVQGLGAAGIYLVMNLLISLWGNQLGMEEEEIKELQDRQAVPEVFKTLMLGKPMFNTWNTTNPFSLIYDMTAKPLVDGIVQEDKSVLDGVQSLVLSNLASRGNPIIKSIAEVFGGVDVIGGSINDTTDRYGFWENVLRKSSGYIIGSSAANALTNLYFKDAPNSDMSTLELIDLSIKNVVAAELGNSRAFKTSLKNYYRANSIVNTFRFAESLGDKEERTNFTNSFNKEGYDDLRKEISRALARKAKPTVIYSLIQDAMLKGLSIREVRSAVNNNLIRYKLEQIKNTQSFLNSLNDSELKSIQDALAYETELFPWLDELRLTINEEMKKQSGYNNYVRRPFFRRGVGMPRTNFNSNTRTNGNYYRLPFARAQDPYKAFRQSWYNLNPPIEKDKD
jgi:hypothetical protein